MHFLAFDLFVARWMYLDARERGWPAGLLSPLLALTLMFGPLGLGAYLGLRAVGLEALRDFFARVRAGSRPLWWVTLGSAALLADVAGPAAGGRPAGDRRARLDEARQVRRLGGPDGPGAGLDPGPAPRTRRLGRAAAVISLVAALELVIITVQAARGVASHFNNASPLDTALFATMGLAITVLWLAQLYIAIRAFRHTFTTPARTWAIRLGLAGALAGGAIGFSCRGPRRPSSPSCTRAASPPPWAATRSVSPTAARACPSPAGAPRAATCASPTSSACTRCRCCRSWPGRSSAGGAPSPRARVVAAGAGWLGLVGVTLWQALRGRPLLTPDAATLVGLMVLAAATAAIALLPTALRRQQPAAARA
jgi:hypothetical protein